MSTFYLLLVTAVAAALALVFMSYMTSEAESAADWFQQAFLGTGVPKDEHELKKRRAAKMDRLLNEKIRVPPATTAKDSKKDARRKESRSAKDRKAKASGKKDESTDQDTPELRKRKTRSEGKKEKSK